MAATSSSSSSFMSQRATAASFREEEAGGREREPLQDLEAEFEAAFARLYAREEEESKASHSIKSRKSDHEVFHDSASDHDDDDSRGYEQREQQHSSVSHELDRAMQRALGIQEAELMHELFDSENENLERVITLHYEKVGLANLDALGKELSARRRQELTNLRRTLESENQSLLNETRQEFEHRLKMEKSAVEADHAQKLETLRAELSQEFSEVSLKQEIENYRLQLDHKAQDEIASAKRRLVEERRLHMNEICEERLQITEKEIQAMEQQICNKFAIRERATIQELDEALRQGANCHREDLVESLEIKLDQAVQERRAFWDSKRNLQQEEFQVDFEKERDLRISEIDLESKAALENEKSRLLLKFKSDLAKETADVVEKAGQRREKAIQDLKNELKMKHEEEIVALRKTIQDEAIEYERIAKAETETELQSELGKEETKLRKDLDRFVEDLKAKFARELIKSKELFAKIVQAGGSPHGFDNDSDSGSDSEPGLPNLWKAPPKGATIVSTELHESLKEAERNFEEMAKELVISIGKVAKLSKELSLAFNKRANEIARLQAELREARHTITQLFKTNQSLTTSG